MSGPPLRPLPQSLLPAAVVALAALTWGLWWLPLRWLSLPTGDLPTGDWPTADLPPLGGLAANVLMNAGGALALLLLALGWRSAARAASPWRTGLLIAGMLSGLGMGLYGLALIGTTVSRAALLFYLAPGWSLLFELLLLGRRFRWRLLLPILLSLAALLLALRVNPAQLLTSLTLGDLAALLSGVAWALGTAWQFSALQRPPAAFGGQRRAPDSLISATLVLTAATLTAAAALAVSGSVWPRLASPTAGLALALGALFLAPVLWAALWGGARVGPMTLNLLLTLELFSALGSSALLSGERFGLAEAMGGLLMLAALLCQALLVPPLSPAVTAGRPAV